MTSFVQPSAPVLINKFNATNISIPPYHAAMLCRFEAIQRQVKYDGGSVMRGWMKLGSVTVEIQYPAGMTAANSINVNQRKLVHFIAPSGSTFAHCNFSQIFGSKFKTITGAS
jgi:hypothetical protein